MSEKKDETKPEEATQNLPVNVEQQIKKQLEAQRGQLGALPTNKIALKDKNFTLPDGQSSPGPIELIVLDFAWNMVHYPGAYNSNNPQQPDCFAIGREKPDSGQLVAHETVKKPYGKTCSDKNCPKNEWKSAITGGGKACKNQRKLIVVPPNFDEETEAMSMFVSPQGLKNFDAYVSRLKAEHGILPVQAVTEVSFDTAQSYPLLKFKFIERNPRVNDAWAFREQCQEMLFRPIELKEGAAKKAA